MCCFCCSLAESQAAAVTGLGFCFNCFCMTPYANRYLVRNSYGIKVRVLLVFFSGSVHAADTIIV